MAAPSEYTDRRTLDLGLLVPLLTISHNVSYNQLLIGCTRILSSHPEDMYLIDYFAPCIVALRAVFMFVVDDIKTVPKGSIIIVHIYICAY